MYYACMDACLSVCLSVCMYVRTYGLSDVYIAVQVSSFFEKVSAMISAIAANAAHLSLGFVGKAAWTAHEELSSNPSATSTRHSADHVKHAQRCRAGEVSTASLSSCLLESRKPLRQAAHRLLTNHKVYANPSASISIHARSSAFA